MRIAACLSWFDEPEGFLERCARSLEGLADVLVALDGPWEHFPHEGPSSPESNREEIVRARIETVMPEPRAWPSQVEKRAELMRLGRETGADWLLVIDGDEYVTRCEGLRDALAETDMDVATVMAERTVEGRHRKPQEPRRLFRASTGVTVEHVHFGYRTADGRWLMGPKSRVRMAPALDATGLLTMRHEHRTRGRERNDAMLGYYRTRRRLRLEDWPYPPWWKQKEAKP